MLSYNVAQHTYTLILLSTQMQQFIFLQIIHYKSGKILTLEGNHCGIHENVKKK